MIHKQTLRIIDEQQIELPSDARILSVANQRDQLCVWYEFSERLNEKKTTTIIIVGTGNRGPETAVSDRFIGTVLMMEGDLVWHVFEREGRIG